MNIFKKLELRFRAKPLRSAAAILLSLIVSKCAFAVYNETIKITEAPASDPAYTYGSIGDIAFKIPKKYQFFVTGTTYVDEKWARTLTASTPGTESDQIEQFGLILHKQTLEPCCDPKQPEKMKNFIAEVRDNLGLTMNSKNWFTAIVNRSYSEKPATNEEPKKYFKRRVDDYIQEDKNAKYDTSVQKYIKHPIFASGKKDFDLNYYLSPLISEADFTQSKQERDGRGINVRSIFYDDDYTTFIQCENRYKKTPELTHCRQTEYWPELNVSVGIEYLYEDIPNWQRYKSHIKKLLESFVIPKTTPITEINKKDVK